MISFFNLNVNDAFDNVSHFHLFHKIKKENFRQIVKMNEKFF